MAQWRNPHTNAKRMKTRIRFGVQRKSEKEVRGGNAEKMQNALKQGLNWEYSPHERKQ